MSGSAIQRCSHSYNHINPNPFPSEALGRSTNAAPASAADLTAPIIACLGNVRFRDDKTGFGATIEKMVRSCSLCPKSKFDPVIDPCKSMLTDVSSGQTL